MTNQFMDLIDEPMHSMDVLLNHIEKAYEKKPNTERLLVAIAGAPGSGKSSLAEQLKSGLNQKAYDVPDKAVIVPMDGFHLDNVILIARDQMAVKGAPQTFDIEGFRSLLARLAAPISPSYEDSAQNLIYIPLFDRDADLSRNAAQCVERQHGIVIIEGNYLLLNRHPWSTLKSLFDVTIMLDVSMETLERRLIQRWLDHGHTESQAQARARLNDLPNAELVLQESTQAHVVFKSVRQ